MSAAALRAEIRAKMAATPKHVRIAALSSISSLPPPPGDEAFDLPGHGSSDKPHRAYPVEFFARADEAVMRDAQI